MLDIRNPLVAGLEGVMARLRRPGALDDLLCSGTLHHNLVCVLAGLSEDKEVHGVVEIVAVDDRVTGWILRLESYGPARLGGEQLGDDREGVLVVHGELVVLLGATVGLCGEELDVGLLGGQAHGVAARLAGGIAPHGLVLETVVNAGKGEAAKGERGEETGLVLLVLLVGFGEAVAVVDLVAVGEAGLAGFVEHEDDLGC